MRKNENLCLKGASREEYLKGNYVGKNNRSAGRHLGKN